MLNKTANPIRLRLALRLTLTKNVTEYPLNIAEVCVISLLFSLTSMQKARQTMLEAEANKGQQRILVVEDDYLISTEISHAVEEAGALVIGPAMNVADALVFTEQVGMLDGAVLDINLRHEVVYPVAQSLRRHGVPFVFATGYNHAAIPKEFASIECFEKPVDYHATKRTLLATPIWTRSAPTPGSAPAEPS